MLVRRLMPTPEMKAFFQEKVWPVIRMLFDLKYDVAMVQQRFTENKLATIMRYRNHNIRVEPLGLPDVFSAESGKNTVLNMGCYVEDGQPSVALLMPELMHTYYTFLEGFANKDAVFESILVILLMHEFDHLAYGLINEPNETDERMIDHEEIAWGFTCAFTIRHMMNVKPLHFSHQELCQAWLKHFSEKNAGAWRNLIATHYCVKC